MEATKIFTAIEKVRILMYDEYLDILPSNTSFMAQHERKKRTGNNGFIKE